MSDTKLIRSLRDQGFLVTEDGPKITVTKNRNKAMHTFHRSSLDKNGRVYLEIIKDLKSMGFVAPDEWERRRKAERRAEDKPYVCDGADNRFGAICGCGQRFAQPMHLARHLQGVANRQGVVVASDGAVLPPVDKPETTRPTPVDDVKQIKRAVKNLMRMANETLAAAELLVRVVEENDELKRKLSKVEDLFGKVLDEL